jgi:prolyl-tRNA synthetase
MSGIYVYLPLGLKVLAKISNIVRKHMNSCGAIELMMSALQPMEIWQKTGRDKDLEEVLIRFRDRKGRELCLGPTHEEEITEIVKRFVSSYKQLPLTFYQIQTKFRDEPRPRYGILRSCEFVMKDAYSFDADWKGLEASYEKMVNAYNKIFQECGLKFVVVEADPGAMGGDVSHEFMVPAQSGEDVLFLCENCHAYYREEGSCKKCNRELTIQRMIEVGHVFKLGTKYSIAQGAYFVDKDGARKPLIMGCYGIGVSRVMAAVVEQNSDQKGIIWPSSISPFDAALVIIDVENKRLFKKGLRLGEDLEKIGFDILIDDRNQLPGVKFNDVYLIGCPYVIIVGKKFLGSDKVELEIRRTGEKRLLGKEELTNFLKKSCNKIA